MTGDEERAATERTHLLLVHDAANASKNLAPIEPAGPISPVAQAPATPDDDRYDLAGLKAERFPSRTPVARTTDAHRSAVYAASAEPVASGAEPPIVASVLLDTPSSDLSGLVSSRKVATVRRHELRVPHAMTVSVAAPRPHTKRRKLGLLCLALGLFGGLLFFVILALGRAPREEALGRAAGPLKAPVPSAEATQATLQVSQAVSAPKPADPAPPISKRAASTPRASSPVKGSKAAAAEDDTPQAIHTRRVFE